MIPEQAQQVLRALSSYHNTLVWNTQLEWNLTGF